MSTPELPPPPVGLLESGEVALLKAWAEDYAAACVAAERERWEKAANMAYAALVLDIGDGQAEAEADAIHALRIAIDGIDA